jgi:hypothetical protein
MKIFYMKPDKILNMKVTYDMKEAVRVAAFNAGFPNSSQFMLSLLNKNPYVKQALEKKRKKVA